METPAEKTSEKITMTRLFVSFENIDECGERECRDVGVEMVLNSHGVTRREMLLKIIGGQMRAGCSSNISFC